MEAPASKFDKLADAKAEASLQGWCRQPKLIRQCASAAQGVIL